MIRTSFECFCIFAIFVLKTYMYLVISFVPFHILSTMFCLLCSLFFCISALTSRIVEFCLVYLYRFAFTVSHELKMVYGFVFVYMNIYNLSFTKKRVIREADATNDIANSVFSHMHFMMKFFHIFPNDR